MLLRDHLLALNQEHHAVNNEHRAIDNELTQEHMLYDFVLSLRHDMKVLVEVTRWPGDMSQMLFPALRGTIKVDCEWRNDRPGCKPKADDKLLWTPRRHLLAVLQLLAPRSLYERGMPHPHDVEFIPHFFVEHFVQIPAGALSQQYHNHALTNGSCADDYGKRQRAVPSHLRLSFAADVGRMQVCGDEPLWRLVPHRE